MFEQCNTLADLNAARVQAVSSANSEQEIVEINNAVNVRRKEILSMKKKYVELKKIVVTPREVVKYCEIPIGGRSPVAGQLCIGKTGILF